MPKDGWYQTEKYGEVYVAPGGTAWIVNKELKSVQVPLLESDIIRPDSLTRRIKAEQRKKQPSYTKLHAKRRRIFKVR